MITERVRELAAGIGAELAPSLPESEIVSFRLGRHGGLTTTLASGEVVQHATPEEVQAAGPAYVDKYSELLSMMCLLVPGGRMQAGVTYFRRRIQTGDANHGVIFTEGGR